MKEGRAEGEEGKPVPLSIRFLSAPTLHGEPVTKNCTDEVQVRYQSEHPLN